MRSDGAPMTRVRARVVRAGLVFFSGLSAVLGGYVLASPDGFFSWPWVNLGMAYNPHLMLDYGAMTLATAVFLGGAALSMNLAFVRTALASYSVWSVAHFLIHLHFYRAHGAAHGSGAEPHLLVTILAMGAAASLTLLLLTIGRPRRPRLRQEHATTTAEPAHGTGGEEPGTTPG